MNHIYDIKALPLVISASNDEDIEIAAKVGWDGVFNDWKAGKVAECAEKIRSLGMIYQSVHAPFHKCRYLWYDDESSDRVKKELLDCISECAAAGVDLVIMHAYIGFDDGPEGFELGFERFGEIFDRASSLGVTVAVENTEGQRCLEALLERFSEYGNVRFCLDTGHRMCYNDGDDLIGKYGDRLFALHINDNMGVTGDVKTWLDDSHMLPFDGVYDWNEFATVLPACGYCSELTFELIQYNRPERHTHDIYAQLDREQFFTLALERAKKLREMLSHR